MSNTLLSGMVPGTLMMMTYEYAQGRLVAVSYLVVYFVED